MALERLMEMTVQPGTTYFGALKMIVWVQLTEAVLIPEVGSPKWQALEQLVVSGYADRDGSNGYRITNYGREQLRDGYNL